MTKSLYNSLGAVVLAILLGFFMFDMNGKEAILLYYAIFISLQVSDVKKKLGEE